MFQTAITVALALLTAQAPSTDPYQVELKPSSDRVDVFVAVPGQEQAPFTTVWLTSQGGSYEDGHVPYLHPVFSPDGRAMTRAWPMKQHAHTGEEQDHPHHRSFWFAHGAVNGF